MTNRRNHLGDGHYCNNHYGDGQGGCKALVVASDIHFVSISKASLQHASDMLSIQRSFPTPRTSSNTTYLINLSIRWMYKSLMNLYNHRQQHDYIPVLHIGMQTCVHSRRSLVYCFPGLPVQQSLDSCQKYLSIKITPFGAPATKGNLCSLRI